MNNLEDAQEETICLSVLSFFFPKAAASKGTPSSGTLEKSTETSDSSRSTPSPTSYELADTPLTGAAETIAPRITPSAKYITPEKVSIPTLHAIHPISQLKKWNPTKERVSKNFWHSKLINDIEDMPALNLSVAETEVFAQEFKRALCPSYLFRGHNPYTKYRVGLMADSKLSAPPIFVISESIDFINSFRMEQYSSHRNQGAIIPGLGICTFFAKFLGDMDVKFSNIGIRRYRYPQCNYHTFTQLDGGCSFAGLLPILYDHQEWFIGFINARDLEAHPATVLSPHNYLEAIQQGKLYQHSNQYLEYLSNQPDMIQETAVAALRCALVPSSFLELLCNAYFSSRSFSQRTKKKILDFIKTHQEHVIGALTTNQKIKDYFFSHYSLVERIFLKTLVIYCEDLKNFIPYGKEPLIAEPERFDELFINENSKRLMSFLLSVKTSVLRDLQSSLIHGHPQANVQNQLESGLLKVIERTLTLAQNTAPLNIAQHVQREDATRTLRFTQHKEQSASSTNLRRPPASHM